MIPGEYFLQPDPIDINTGRATATVDVTNRGDRPVQVGSHCHFFEVNRALDFDRAKALGLRLDIPAGTAVRFEPGQRKTVTLTTFGGEQILSGLNDLTQGLELNDATRATIIERARAAGFKGV